MTAGVTSDSVNGGAPLPRGVSASAGEASGVASASGPGTGPPGVNHPAETEPCGDTGAVEAPLSMVRSIARVRDPGCGVTIDCYFARTRCPARPLSEFFRISEFIYGEQHTPQEATLSRAGNTESVA